MEKIKASQAMGLQSLRVAAPETARMEISAEEEKRDN